MLKLITLYLNFLDLFSKMYFTPERVLRLL